MDDEVNGAISMFDGSWCGLCHRRFYNQNNPQGYTRCPQCGERATWSLVEEQHMTTREIELRDFRVGRGVELERRRSGRKKSNH